MRYVVSVLAILYALVCLYAALGLWKKPGRRKPAVVMMVGAVILVLAGVLELCGWGPAWLVTVIGSLLICQGALMNGKLNGNDKLQNHAVRFLITVFLIFCGIIW